MRIIVKKRILQFVSVCLVFCSSCLNDQGVLYEPTDEWIDLFEKAGAEYFVYTTKHNNGWCNWPSKISEHSAKVKNGPWDLVSPLVESARKAGMKVGLYYNLMNRLKGVSPEMAQNPELELTEEYAPDYLHPEINDLDVNGEAL